MSITPSQHYRWLQGQTHTTYHVNVTKFCPTSINKSNLDWRNNTRIKTFGKQNVKTKLIQREVQNQDAHGRKTRRSIWRTEEGGIEQKHGQRAGTVTVDKKCVSVWKRWRDGGRGQLPTIKQPILGDILNLHLALNWMESLGWVGC